jgi:flagellin
MNILDGSFVGDEGVAGKFAFQIGANEGQTVTHTLGDIGFRKAVIETEVTREPAAAVAQRGTITLSGTYAAGDSVSVNLSGTAYSYTVIAADVASDDNDTNLAAIATKLKAVIPAGTATSTVSGAVITYTAAANNVDLAATVSRTVVGDEAALAGIQDLDIATTPKASDALAALDIGIDTINSARADIGAMINRLTYAVDNLTNVSQYTSASRSTIQDADYAKASSELARTQIIQQAATAVLAQANQQTQTVLKLLQ